MKIPKKKCRVDIFCTGGSTIRGVIHISEGLRVLDSLNDNREMFMAVTDADFLTKQKEPAAQSGGDAATGKRFVIVNKKAVEWVEEL